MRASGRGPAGSAYFVDGMSSSADPIFISDRSYRHGQNILNRGGVLRTRPGYSTVGTVAAGLPQALVYFRPLSGDGNLVEVISGRAWVRAGDLSLASLLPGIQLFSFAPSVYWASAVKSVEKNPADGTLQAVEPKRVLILQDGGFTRAAYWDGVASGHSDPTVVSDSAGNVLSAGIPLGGPIAWSGDRLWVAQKNKLFASDIADPLSFTENEYAGEGGFFSFDDDIVALAETPSLENPVLLVFTATKTYQILSSIRERASWKTVNNFKSVLFPNVGCVSQRSVAAQNGLLWWYSPQAGLVNLNSAQQARLSSRITPQDTAMAVSKFNTFSRLDGVASGAFENFLLVSVPYADLRNQHTWVYDSAVLSEVEQGSSGSWASVWTGTRPVEWASGLFNGLPRCFHLSVDSDGTNRLWESFVSDRRDNSSPIECFVETKTHIDFSDKATGLDRKKIVFAEVTFTGLLGSVEVDCYWAGTRGSYHKAASFTIESTEGSIDSEVELTDEVSTYRAQQRRLKCPNVSYTTDGECTTCKVESDATDWIDTGFSLLIVWRGIAALHSYRLFCDPEQESSDGGKEFTETGPKILSGSVCSS